MISSAHQTPATDTAWLEALRARLRELPLHEHDAVVRSLIADWSKRHTGAERLAANPAWESFDSLLAEDRATDTQGIMGP